MMACAKMIGITPAAFTFKGRKLRVPPYCLLPTILLAYWIGMRRVPCTSRMEKQMTSISTISSMMKMIGPPFISVMRETASK